MIIGKHNKAKTEEELNNKLIEEKEKNKQLEQTLEEKNKKIEFARKIFVDIKLINESNSYGNFDVKTRKISELCSVARQELLN